MQIPPSQRALERLYYELGQRGARAMGKKRRVAGFPALPEALIAYAADAARYDPRLFEILVEFLLRSWQRFNPYLLRMAMREMQTPQVFGVIWEFHRSVGHDMEREAYWRYCLHGLRPVPTQMFYHQLYAVGGKLAERAATEAVAQFKAWGFLATQRPIIAQDQKRGIGDLDRASRVNRLRRLLARQSTITLSEYLVAVDQTISRQQAYLDLKQFPGLSRRGHGRGAVWTLAI